MYGAGNPQMAALGALGALSGSLRDWAMSPVRNWGQTSLSHKIVAAGAGAGLAYYLYQKGMGDIAVAAAGIGGAYATSMLMHSRQTIGAQANGTMLSNGQPAAALPPNQVQDMAAQANAVINGAHGSNLDLNENSRWSALGPAASSIPAAPSTPAAPDAPITVAPVVSAPSNSNENTGVGNSQWAALG